MNTRARRLRRIARKSRDARAYLVSIPITGQDKEGNEVVKGYSRLMLGDKGKARREYRKHSDKGAMLQSFTRPQVDRLPAKFRIQAQLALGI